MIKACRIPEPQLTEVLRVLETQVPNVVRMLRGHLAALEEEKTQLQAELDELRARTVTLQ